MYTSPDQAPRSFGEAPTSPTHQHGNSHQHGHGRQNGHAQQHDTHDKGTWLCPMHPEVTSDHPGRCPKCGMFLQPADGGDAPAAQHHDHQHPTGEPAVVAGAVAAGDWTCPMHPEVRSDGPGDCPICGMALERVSAGLDDGPNQELVDMRRRFRVAAVLSVPLVAMVCPAPTWLPLLALMLDKPAYTDI